MESFLYKLFLFCLPIMILYALPAFFLHRSGEFKSLDDVVTIQQQKTTLFGPAYRDQNKTFKSLALSVKAPVIVVVGTSRVMGFRDSLFEKNFYNAGGIITTANDLSEVQNVFPNKKPKIIILGIDPYFLDPVWNSRYYATLPSAPEKQWRLFLRYSWKQFYIDYFRGKISIAKILKRNPESLQIGLTAVMENKGFRNDGSYSYGDLPLNELAHKKNLSETKLLADNIAAGMSDFEFGKTTDASALVAIHDFLKWANQEKIHVIGFATPFSPALNQSIRHREDLNIIVKKQMTALNDIFKETGFPFFDFSNPLDLGATDAEMLDYMHVKEELYERIILRMSENNQALRSIINKTVLGNHVVK